jgi:hypothetical protein
MSISRQKGNKSQFSVSHHNSQQKFSRLKMIHENPFLKSDMNFQKTSDKGKIVKTRIIYKSRKKIIPVFCPIDKSWFQSVPN